MFFASSQEANCGGVVRPHSAGGSGAAGRLRGIKYSWNVSQFLDALGVARWGFTGSTCGWSILWGRADIKERRSRGTCTHAAALRHATELWTTGESLSRAPFSHCHTMGTNASILLLITLWASVQDGEYLSTFSHLYLSFFGYMVRHGVTGKIQIPAAFSFVYDKCFKKHVSLMFRVHVPAMCSVALQLCAHWLQPVHGSSTGSEHTGQAASWPGTDNT